MRNRIFSSRRQIRKDATCNTSQRSDTTLKATNSWTRQSRLGLAGRLIGWLGVAAAILLSHVQAPAQVISRVSAPEKFFVDDKASLGLLFNYAAYMVSNNTAATIPSVYVAITNENHTIFVMNGPPGVGSLLSSATYGFTNIIYAIEALANKVTIITNLNPAALLGSQVVMLIGGDTGTIGGQNSVSFSPAVLGGWRPDAYELVGTKVIFTQNPTFTNQIYFDPSIAGFTNFSGQSYTNTFFFRAVKPTGTNIAISPFDYVDSGSGTKHTAFSSLSSSGGSNIIYSATNVISILNQSVTPNSLFAPGGTVTYSITFTNFAMGA